MTTWTAPEPSAWAALADGSEETRRAEMRRHYEGLARLSEEERQRVLTALAKAEYQLPDAKLRALTRSRLLAWLDMNKEQASALAASYDQVMRQMPGTVAMRRVAEGQTVTRLFSVEQVLALRQLHPSIGPELPPLVIERPPVTVRPTEVAAAGQKPQKAPWQFWKRG